MHLNPKREWDRNRKKFDLSSHSAQLSRAVKADEIRVEPTQPLRLALIPIKHQRLDSFAQPLFLY